MRRLPRISAYIFLFIPPFSHMSFPFIPIVSISVLLSTSPASDIVFSTTSIKQISKRITPSLFKGHTKHRQNLPRLNICSPHRKDSVFVNSLTHSPIEQFTQTFSGFYTHSVPDFWSQGREMGELSGIILYYFGPQLTPISRLIAPHLVGHTSKLFLGCLYFCFQCTIKINHSFAMQKLRFHLELLGEFQDKIIRNSPQRSIWFPVLDFCIRSRNKLISLPKAKKHSAQNVFGKFTPPAFSVNPIR